MEKHHSCLITRAIIEYFQEHYPERVQELFAGLGPEIEKLPDPLAFLLEINNWVSSQVVIRMFENARQISSNPRVAFDIGFESTARRKFGYIQRILLMAYKTPRRSLTRAQKINDKFNRNKRLELVETTRDTAILRLHWFPEIPAIADFCLFNRGIYTAIPTVWNMPPGLLKETKCFFKGDSYCEYHMQWVKKFSFRQTLLKIFAPWRALKNTIEELEQDKELLKQKFAEVHVLNLQLQETVLKLENSERRYRELVENAHEGIWVTDAQGAIQFFNRRMCEITGVEDLQGKSIQEFFAAPHRAVLARALRKNRGGKVAQAELEILSFQRGAVAVLMNSVPYGEDGRFLGAFAMFSDITAKKEMEHQQQQVQKMEAIGTLAGGIAHDFNNILTAILGNISLARLYQTGDDNLFQSLTDAEQAALRAKGLAQQLLTFSKGGTPVKEACNPAEIAREAIKFACTGSPVQYHFTFPDDLWSVEADPGQISQVIQNLGINAVQAMPEGGALEVWAANVMLEEEEEENELPLKPGKYVRITLQDHGLGIPAKHLNRIFDPYFTTKSKGSGLGLATVYSIIKNHEGHITVASELGVGTTFDIYLPASHLQEAPKGLPEEIPHIGKGKILLMDDEEIVRLVAGKILMHLGYEAEFAQDGAEALELYQKARTLGAPFDLVIMDLTVPGGMGGKETMQLLREMDPLARGLVSSGYSDDPVITNYQAYGFSGYIQKPYKVREFSKALFEVLFPRDS